MDVYRAAPKAIFLFDEFHNVFTDTIFVNRYMLSKLSLAQDIRKC
jgi:hypothetical protein